MELSKTVRTVWLHRNCSFSRWQHGGFMVLALLLILNFIKKYREQVETAECRLFCPVLWNQLKTITQNKEAEMKLGDLQKCGEIREVARGVSLHVCGKQAVLFTFKLHFLKDYVSDLFFGTSRAQLLCKIWGHAKFHRKSRKTGKVRLR